MKYEGIEGEYLRMTSFRKEDRSRSGMRITKFVRFYINPAIREKGFMIVLFVETPFEKKTVKTEFVTPEVFAMKMRKCIATGYDVLVTNSKSGRL